MRALGVDLGTKRIGIALSDALGLTAQPLAVLPCRGQEADATAVQALVAAHQVSVVVIGLPLALDGRRGPPAQRAEAFARRVQAQVAVPVKLVDERFTTAQGQRALLETGVRRAKRKQVIDQVAAQLILQQYLDAARDPSR
ncbi:MAG: Holliday junction resolvase RuvX [Candidatus Omnitrophica bacterium]|nr:Holliday junction resolvase RuvX [Candidatus Omnitrophota bacterium]